MTHDPPPPAEPELTRRRPIYLDFNVLQLVALVFLLDQLTKYVVIELLNPGMSYPFRGFFRFTHVHNTGSAFGIFQGLNTPLIFVSFVGIVILALIYRSQPNPSNLLRFSLGLQLGGALGNLLDRLRLGFVTDFIDIGPWPVFNIADAAIVTGLIILGWVFTNSGSSKPEPHPAAEEFVPQPVPSVVDRRYRATGSRYRAADLSDWEDDDEVSPVFEEPLTPEPGGALDALDRSEEAAPEPQHPPSSGAKAESLPGSPEPPSVVSDWGGPDPDIPRARREGTP
jgi:signal peptidase II